DAGEGPVPVPRVLQRDERADLLGEVVDALGREVHGVLAEPRLDLGEPSRDLQELLERGLLALAGAVGVVHVEALARAEGRLEAGDLGRVEAGPAVGAPGLERVEVALDPGLELGLPVVRHGRGVRALLRRLDDGGAPGAALRLAREQLLALQPGGEERALALLLQPDDPDLHHPLRQPLLAVEAAGAQILELAAELAELAGAVALGLEVAGEAVTELAVAQDLVGDLAKLGCVLLAALGAPHGGVSSGGGYTCSGGGSE